MIAEIYAHIRRPATVLYFVHYIYRLFDIQTMKLFIEREMTIKGHSRTLPMSSFMRSAGHNQRPEK